LAEELARLVPGRLERGDDRLLRALLAGYPDRVARRREPGSVRLALASGTGARLGRESGVHGSELLLAVEVTGGEAGAAGEPLVRVASRIERDWLEGVASERVHRYEESSGAVRAVLRDTYDALVLGERDVAADPDVAGELLAAELRQRGIGEAGERLERRLRFAGLDASLEAAVAEACRGRTRLPSLDDPERWLDGRTRRELERLAPERIALPSGRSAAVEYRDDGSAHAAVKLQELFGLSDSPRLGPRRQAVVLSLLAPNGRPVQTTSDLRSFWQTTYPEVRRELRGRYPRHPWPEDPWTAEPTHRAKKRA
jgi:ATP-dependent helicase HrpB